ncbi:SGNH/GDSL hydrolase family protein [Aureimonas sp. AU40]|uniref:SGNH/GDSL hydrolase family protein n=1 Tax=Aureimonas sp. AU40 TaxID=1637747 RepID=UPI00078615B0|nr:SGNH/GDSL hydrolase family protein [Aureimonas sp. AU40]
MSGYGPYSKIPADTVPTIDAYDVKTFVVSGRARAGVPVTVKAGASLAGTIHADEFGFWKLTLPADPDGASLTAEVLPTSAPFATPRTLPALPLKTGAKVMGLGHSFIARSGYAFGNAVPPALHNRIDINTGAAFGDMGLLQSMDGRFNVNSWFDKDYAQNRAGDAKGFAGSQAGLGGDDLNGGYERLKRTIDMRPDIVVVDIGTNDVNSRRQADGKTPITLETLKLRLDRILTMLRYAGIWAVVLMPTPRTDWKVGDPRHVTLENFGAWCATLGSREGVKVVDDRKLIRDAIASGQPILEDGIHMTSVGHWIRNSEPGMLLDVLRSMVTAGDFVDRSRAGNLLATGGFLGTNGTKNGGITGSVATSVTVNRGAGQTEAIVASKEVIEAGVAEKQVFTITPAAPAAGVNSLSLTPVMPSYSALGIVAGDWMEALCEVELLSEETIFVGASLQLRYRGGLTMPVTGGVNRRGAENSVPIPFRNGEKLLLRTLPHKMEGLDAATGVSSYMDLFNLAMSWRREASKAFQIKVSPLVFRKVASPRPAWNR